MFLGVFGTVVGEGGVGVFVSATFVVCLFLFLVFFLLALL